MGATRIEVILVMGLMAFGVRALPQLLLVGEEFPEAWERLLRYLSYGLICSIIAVTLFMANARFEVQTAPHRGLALLAAITVAYRTRSAVTGMITGALVSLGLSWLG